MHRVGDGAAGEPDLRLAAGGLHVDQPAEQLAGDGGGEGGGGLVDLDAGVVHSDLLLVTVLATAA